MTKKFITMEFVEEMRYVHISFFPIRKEKILPIKNDWLSHPIGGFWASRDDGLGHSVVDYRRLVDPRYYRFKKFFHLASGSKVLLITNENFSHLPTIDRINDNLSFYPRVDWEELARNYDAVEVLPFTCSSSLFYWFRYDSLIVFNRKVVNFDTF